MCNSSSQVSDKDESDDGLNYCFCRQPPSIDDLVECSSKTCRIKWFHFKCVGLSERTIPCAEWFCPRCQNMDHWCLCGEPEGENEMRLIGCSCEDLCKVEWYHLGCVGLYDFSAGDWYCDECVGTGEAPVENGNKYCYCQRGSEFDTLIECSNDNCSIKQFHKCCIPHEDILCDTWICSNCN